MLFAVLCGVWFRVLSRCLFSSYWKIYISQLQIQPMIWTSTLQIRKHGCFRDLSFIILFVGILPLYAINLGAVSLFADSPFTFLGIWCTLWFEWMNIVLFLSKKNGMFDCHIFSFFNFRIQQWFLNIALDKGKRFYSVYLYIGDIFKLCLSSTRKRNKL